MGLIVFCFLITHIVLKNEFTQYPFFVCFCFSVNKYALFHSHFYMSISTLAKLSHTGQKLSEKILLQRVHLYFKNIDLIIHPQNFWTKLLSICVTVYLVRIWTYKNADEKAHTFSRRSKNVKKRTKTDKKRTVYKFILMLNFTNGQSITSSEWCPHFLLTRGALRAKSERSKLSTIATHA